MPEDPKLVKVNILFRCPMPECLMGDDTNGAECLRCVLISIMGDQQAWDEVQEVKKLKDGTLDISQASIPNIIPELTERDLQFLSSPATILMGQKEWGGEALSRAVEIYRETKFRKQPARIITLPIAGELPEPDESD